MFTGLVEAQGQISGLKRSAQGAQIKILAPEKMISELSLGESVAVDGVCLTVTKWGGRHFFADISLESLRCTTFSSKALGDLVHLERALRMGDRLGGHMVTGHVDGLGRITDFRQEGGAIILRIKADAHVLMGLVPKGSIAIDGISLTVNSVDEQSFEVCLVKHTQSVVCIHKKKVDDVVNLETDIIGKYIYRLMGETRMDSNEHHGSLNLQFLQETGFIK